MLESTAERVVLDLTLGRFSRDSLEINGRAYARITLDQGCSAVAAGDPDLPSIRRSIVVPNDARMAVRVLASQYYEIAGIDVAPSRGSIPRSANPAELPYTFGASYRTDAEYPGELVFLGTPYILRDQRGLVVTLNPFQYNPLARTLRVYTNLTIEVFRDGPAQINGLERRDRAQSLAFQKLYRHQFLNYDPPGRYPPLDETGDMLIICHDPWLPNVQPLVDHKNSLGINTTAVGVSAIGNNAAAIQNYIQSVYDSSDLAFVLLVGDVAQVPTLYSGGGPSDPSYAKLAGTDDYPDIMVGRFSAATVLDVNTQVQRTIEYELLPATQQDWFWRGSGIGADTPLLDSIRDELLAHGYTLVDQLYDPDATAAMIAAALNDGRGFVNYNGHGGSGGWYPSGFSITHIESLVNADMLPFIFNAASSCGDFELDECFAEAWLRAQTGGQPTGAIGAYMSAVYQYWSETQVAQHEFVDLYLSETHVCFGTLCFAASCRMMDEYGPTGVQLFDGWILFGDPSLRVVGSWLRLPGDCDDDGDVDCGDFSLFSDCMAGPDNPDPGCDPDDFAAADTDDDNDVDLADFGTFQTAFTGSSR